ncbi:helix-turn-helix transcriptional regulator [uncultured Oscillibacter sp.]|uniref:helix-turn-helix domain-containing protein n=1 Tax=uncultured Oscillibacter sp. TaxID=876091 RepID=UPI0025F3D1A5|nr:helix-turn-helix transcriptional regulator [uncultured Oscillibacter sp.]
MPEGGRNIYKICREQAGYTQERAAELLPCSVRALARYESGECGVPGDLAYRMVQLYSSQFLAVEHLRNESRLAASIIPAVDDCTLQTAAIRLVNRVLRFAEEHRDRQLMEIIEDGVITGDERPLMDDIMADITEIVRACTEVRIAAKQE